MEILGLYFLSCILCQKLLHHGNILNRKNMSPIQEVFSSSAGRWSEYGYIEAA